MWGLLRYTKIYNKKSPWRYQHQGDVTRTPKSITSRQFFNLV